ncbi:tetratricopeptide repeat protein [uncultured Erythrobacter sp.]|uniref:tetratricopeptide repeat protein n=1 Tax=uncultured Erythrobacter sp. TaxID=263913 RepID=UPI00262C50B0|nr:tetratricopeptide repeat protein [uncultured Erythrobacter sp.]
MARTPTQTPNDEEPEGPSREDEILMREIDEAVRQDDALEFFQKYGVTLGVSISLLLAGMLGYWWWDSTTEAELERQSETIVSALDSADVEDFAGATAKVEPLIEDGSPGARSAARFLQAAAALEQDEPARAVELYAAIAADEEAPQPLRDLALIREVSTNFDDREPADVIAKLQGLAVPGNAFFGSAGELVAVAHLEAGNRDLAGTLFAEIARDESQPETLRSRARQMAGLLGVDAIDDVEQLLEDEGVIPAGGAAR